MIRSWMLWGIALVFLAGTSVLAEEKSTGPAISETLGLGSSDIASLVSFNDATNTIASENNSVIVTDGGYAHCGDVGCGCCGPHWNIKAGAMLLQRETLDQTVLVTNTVSGQPIAVSHDFNFNSGTAVDLSAIRTYGCGCNSLELRYFGVDNILAEQTFTTSAIWNFPTDPPLFGLGVAQIQTAYLSRLYNLEINLRHRYNEDVTLLAGFRWVEMYDHLDFNADFGGNQATIRDTTSNRLYGAQIGADVKLFGSGMFSIDGIGKAGVYGNNARNEFQVTQAIGPAFGARDKQSPVAFVGEVGLTCALQLTNNLSIRGGYQLFWLENVAAASSQISAIDVINQGGVDPTGSALFHGATANVEYAW